ncbi:MAG: tetratricopeptide repeat protein [Alphaproteobacteria bacterium]
MSQSPEAAGVQEWWRSAVAANNEGRLDEAAELCGRILGVSPAIGEAQHLLGVVRARQGRYAEAAEILEQAVRANPRGAHAQNALGEVLRKLGARDRAEAAFAAAVGADANFARARQNLGIILAERFAHAEALPHLQQAAALQPSAQAYNNLGAACRFLGRLDDAARNFAASLDMQPGFAEAMSNLALVLRDQGRVAEALLLLEEAATQEAAKQAVYDNYLWILHNSAAIPGAEIERRHRAWGEAFAKNVRPIARAAADLSPDRKLRIGYLSPDLRQHAVAHFIEPPLARHDRQLFEIFIYANVPRADRVTERLRALVPNWRDILPLDDDAAAALIARDGVDILVDLAGHTGGNRLGVLARKPAPIQMTWLGYPNITGLPTIDYHLTDATADPPGVDAGTSERKLRLADGFLCYRPPNDAPPVAPSPCLDAKTVTFGSFNALAKASDRIVALWAQILQRAPNSRLVIKAHALADAATREDVRDRFESLGVAGARLELRPPTASTRDHLAAYADIDVALDTFPYTGTTTTCEALWMGVPVLTLAGQHHVARVSASILHNAGLDEMIAATPDDYVAKAVAWAADPQRLVAWRSQLRPHLTGRALLDAARFTGNLENAYREAWREWCARARAVERAAPAQKENSMAIRLHIGGRQAKPGWQILNIQPGPGVDYVGSVSDLSRFADNSVEEIYASHVMEHLSYATELLPAIKEIRRILKPGGAFRMSVPDLEILSALFIDKQLPLTERYRVMRMIFGGQIDKHDFHKAGLSWDIAVELFRQAGFAQVSRVESFNLFENDASSTRVQGRLISLNVVATK